ncbi:hypothetical protein HDZ31DRAFT_64718 [Schizophyllum fasciatum]
MSRLSSYASLFALPLMTTASAPAGPDEFNYASSSRTASPTAIHGHDGDADNAEGLLCSDAKSTTLRGVDTAPTLATPTTLRTSRTRTRAGATSALTACIVGLTLTEPAARRLRMQLQLGHLPAAKCGFETPLWWFGVSWAEEAKEVAAGRCRLDVTASERTRGGVVLPVKGEVTGDGVIWEGDVVEVAGETHVVTDVAQ